ncbi:MAG TPA: HlyD family efflux transporter periplasmic adaptor subunit, partial [Flavipsychrobacter sp.]|nr:HlyD family efflux transporter periplasmic adaptor subunit [Flavipsychrobacter sp.]
SSIAFYPSKVSAPEAQAAALKNALQLKVQQTENKIQQLRLKISADSMEMVAARNDYNIATEQFSRARIMRDSGLLSLVQLEQRNQGYQNAVAKKTIAEIKFTNTKTDLVNAHIELSQVRQEYFEKIFKTQSDKASAQSDIATSQAEVAKLSNQYSNFKIRAGMYYLIAPQSGQVIQARKAGINEIVSEGEMLVEIVPRAAQLAVELFVRPVDLPLLSIGQKVSFLFDGYPAIVFSGWPEASYGTFQGKIAAIESSVSANGKFRVLVSEMEGAKKWPTSLKMGTGAAGIALLKDVPIWYELWRNINGFPPDYYKPHAAGNEKK